MPGSHDVQVTGTASSGEPHFLVSKHVAAHVRAHPDEYCLVVADENLDIDETGAGLALKPGNIMLKQKEGGFLFKIIDFGISHVYPRRADDGGRRRRDDALGAQGARATACARARGPGRG